MPVMDDIREQAKKAKGKGFKYAVSYFWGYYKFLALGIIVAAAIIFSLAKAIITAKPTGFEAILIDAYYSPSDEAVAAYLGIDTEKYTVYQDVSYQFSMENGAYTQLAYTTAQKLAAAVASKEVDVVICNPEIFSKYKNSLLGNLEDYFSKEFLDSLGDKVIYSTIIDNNTEEEIGPFPMAIDVSDAPQLFDTGAYKSDSKVYFCIVPNTTHPDLCVEYYNFLYTDVVVSE